MKKESDFLKQLNQRASQAKIPSFLAHTQNGDVSKTYAYTYIEVDPKESTSSDSPPKSETKAREIAAWLLSHRIDSEILYVDLRKAYMVKIPFVNTYYKDFFEKKEMPKEITEMCDQLVDVVKRVDYSWAGPISRVQRALIQFAESQEHYRTLRKLDMVQTTLFATGQYYGNSSMINQLVSKWDDYGKFKPEINELIDAILFYDGEFKRTEKIMLKFSRNEKLDPVGTLTEFLKRNKKAIDGFINIMLNQMETHNTIYRLDNDIYKQWLFINQQLEALENGGKYTDADGDKFVSRWKELKQDCMANGKKARQYLLDIPLHIGLVDRVTNYMSRYFSIYCLDDTKALQATAPEKKILDACMEKNEGMIEDIRSEYSRLKPLISSLAREVFETKNPPKNKEKPHQAEEAAEGLKKS